MRDIFLDYRMLRGLRDLFQNKVTCVTFETSLEISCLELPNFYATIFRSGGQLSITGVKSKRGYVGFMSFKFKLGWCFGEVHILKRNVFMLMIVASFF